MYKDVENPITEIRNPSFEAPASSATDQHGSNTDLTSVFHPCSSVSPLPGFRISEFGFPALNVVDRLKICVLAACPFPANHGTPGSIREICEALAELGHEVHIVTYHFGEDIPL